MKPITLKALVAGGAVRMICHFHLTIGGNDPKWVAATDFASREFRAAKPETIKALIKRCRKAFDEAQELNITFRKRKSKVATAQKGR